MLTLSIVSSSSLSTAWIASSVSVDGSEGVFGLVNLIDARVAGRDGPSGM